MTTKKEETVNIMQDVVETLGEPSMGKDVATTLGNPETTAERILKYALVGLVSGAAVYAVSGSRKFTPSEAGRVLSNERWRKEAS